MVDAVVSVLDSKQKFTFALLAFFGAIIASACHMLDVATLRDVLETDIVAYLAAEALHGSVTKYAESKFSGGEDAKS